MADVLVTWQVWQCFIANMRQAGPVTLAHVMYPHSRVVTLLPIFVFVNARQPYTVLNQQAWGAALLLLAFVLVINVLVRARSVGRRTR